MNRHRLLADLAAITLALVIAAAIAWGATRAMVAINAALGWTP